MKNFVNLYLIFNYKKLIMKKFSSLFVLMAVTAIFFSCTIGQPITTKSSDNNSTYKISYLFEKDGCKVYRFYDMGHYVYFTNCNSDVTAITNDSLQTRITTISKKNK